MRSVRRAALSLSLITAVVATGCSATTTTAQSAAVSEISIPGTPGPGVTPTEITLASFSYAGTGKPTWDAIVAAYNAAGGIAGHKITMVAQAPPTQTAPGASQADAARTDCLAVTEHPGGVFAVLVASSDPDFTSCVNDHGIVAVPVAGFAIDSSTFERSPYTAVLGLSYERLAAGLAAQLQGAGFLKDAKNVAVVTATGVDDEDSVAQRTLVPLLKSAGVPNVTVTTVDTRGTGEAAASVALKLKSIAPDRIVVFGSAWNLISVVQEVVKQQLAAPVALTDVAVTRSRFEFSGLSNAPESQRVQSVVVNISTQSGAQLQQDRVNAANPAAVKCMKIMSDNHLAADPASLRICESLDLLKAGLDKSGSKQVNAQAFAKGLNALSDFAAISVYQAGFGPGRHDGAGATQLMKYSSACTCFEPAGSPMPVPATK